MQQDRLFIGAPVVLTTQAVYRHGEGWSLTVAMRRDGQQWTDAYSTIYSHLSTEELADVLCSETTQQLGMA